MYAGVCCRLGDAVFVCIDAWLASVTGFGLCRAAAIVRSNF